jgi:hypothetical protein
MDIGTNNKETSPNFETKPSSENLVPKWFGDKGDNLVPKWALEAMKEYNKDAVANESINSEIKLELSALQKENLDKQKVETGLVESGERELLTNKEKGNYGEMKTDIAMAEKGFSRISDETITSLDDSGHKGIDGIYENSEKDGSPKFCIIESKFGSSQLSETDDGKQMSENWIDKRLDDSVGKEKADGIRMEKLMNPGNVESLLSKIDSNGNVTFNKLDSNGNSI